MEDEIKKIQLERAKLEGRLASFASAGEYDRDIYGDSVSLENAKAFMKESGNYDNSIAVNDEEWEAEERKSVESRLSDAGSKKQFLNSFTAPKHFFEETSTAKEDFDPMKELRRKKISEKEDQYHSRWRKRKFSPPRIDAFSSEKQDTTTNTTYKDVMLDVLLEKEKREVLMKIEKKQLEEEEKKLEERRMKEKEHKKELKRKKKESRSSEKTDEQVQNNDKEEDGESEWYLEVRKGGEKLLDVTIPRTDCIIAGRDEHCNLRLEHLSCSKRHAKITFLDQHQDPHRNSPHVMDLNSTNCTILNGQELTPGQWYKLSRNDILKFGCSTREYHVK